MMLSMNSYILDLPDAEVLHNSMVLFKNEKYQFKMRKQVIESVSTKAWPCQQYPQKTCIMRHLFQHFFKKYECYIIMNYDGMYLKG